MYYYISISDLEMKNEYRIYSGNQMPEYLTMHFILFMKNAQYTTIQCIDHLLQRFLKFISNKHK